jgi:hypothetical protein
MNLYGAEPKLLMSALKQRATQLRIAIEKIVLMDGQLIGVDMKP